MPVADPRLPRLLLVVVAGLAVPACAQVPFDYHSGREIPEGPGMVTGAEGRAVLYRSADPPGGGVEVPAGVTAGDEYRSWVKWCERAPPPPECEGFLRWRRAWRESGRVD